jgi:hypothetical protein
MFFYKTREFEGLKIHILQITCAHCQCRFILLSVLTDIFIQTRQKHPKTQLQLELKRLQQHPQLVALIVKLTTDDRSDYLNNGKKTASVIKGTWKKHTV